MKTGHDALNIAGNDSGSSKHEISSRRPSLSSKMSPGAQNNKMGPDALSTAENECGSAKHENGTRRT
jgi:hypothetical protein